MGSGNTLEHLDVLIIGAGLSGIGAACRLRMDHPGRSLALLETRGRPGGTCDNNGIFAVVLPGRRTGRVKRYAGLPSGCGSPERTGSGGRVLL